MYVGVLLRAKLVACTFHSARLHFFSLSSRPAVTLLKSTSPNTLLTCKQLVSSKLTNKEVSHHTIPRASAAITSSFRYDDYLASSLCVPVASLHLWLPNFHSLCPEPATSSCLPRLNPRKPFPQPHHIQTMPTSMALIYSCVPPPPPPPVSTSTLVHSPNRRLFLLRRI